MGVSFPSHFTRALTGHDALSSKTQGGATLALGWFATPFQGVLLLSQRKVESGADHGAVEQD